MIEEDGEPKLLKKKWKAHSEVGRFGPEVSAIEKERASCTANARVVNKKR